MKSAFLETPHNEIKCVLSMNESYFNKKRDKILHLPLVRDEGADSLPPYSQPVSIIRPFLRLPYGTSSKKK